ncbi:hypothetical protein C8Q80DRAFT_327009 [Daedaleopsis nitida]|nr:hypothetical protein C8Q80DRAFT_327009 [Daedaleopsis nitida]
MYDRLRYTNGLVRSQQLPDTDDSMNYHDDARFLPHPEDHSHARSQTPTTRSLPTFRTLRSYLHVFLADTNEQVFDVSEQAAANPNKNISAFIGAAAAGSIILILATIFIGYWIVKRRSRPRVVEDPRPEAPRKAGRHSIVLSSGSSMVESSSASSKEMLTAAPRTRASGQLLSSTAFAVTPMTAAFPLSPPAGRDTWLEAERSPVDLEYGYTGYYNFSHVTIAKPPPTYSKPSGIERPISVKRPPPIDVEQARTVEVEQAVDLGTEGGQRTGGCATAL